MKWTRGEAVAAKSIASTMVVLMFGFANADDIPPPPPMPEDDAARTAPAAPAAARACRDCAVIRSIRSIERERPRQREVPTYMTSEQYLANRSYSQPMVGPVFGMTFGPGQETRSFVGAAGSATMRQRILEIHYEITVRFDDGRLALIEQDDASGLRVGDRVQVVNDRLQPAPAASRQP